VPCVPLPVVSETSADFCQQLRAAAEIFWDRETWGMGVAQEMSYQTADGQDCDGNGRLDSYYEPGAQSNEKEQLADTAK